MKIAIDGPAGAGKSTISKAAAERLGFVYIDTGAMYRAVGLYAVRHGFNPTDEKNVVSILDEIEISIEYNKEGQQIFLNGENVSEDIRTPEISAAASAVATIPAVRLKLVELQRLMAKKADVLMDGRDIGTYVLPDAELKIFLTASVDERAKRRLKDLADKGIEAELETVKADIIARDKNDSEREFAPLREAEDSVFLDNTDLTIDESIDRICELANERRNSK